MVLLYINNCVSNNMLIICWALGKKCLLFTHETHGICISDYRPDHKKKQKKIAY